MVYPLDILPDAKIVALISVGKHDVGSLNRRTGTIGRLGSTSRHPHHTH